MRAANEGDQSMTNEDVAAEIAERDGSVALVQLSTGRVWQVDAYALREHGMAEGGWTLLEDVGPADWIVALRTATGFAPSPEDDDR